MVVVYSPSDTMWYGNILSPSWSSSGHFLSGKEGEILDEICILDNANMVLEALNNDTVLL